MKVRHWLKGHKMRAVAADAGAFLALTTGALCVGLVANQLRDKPLPLAYESKEARMAAEVARAGGSIAAPEPGAAAVEAPEDLDLARFRRALGESRVIVLDARPEIFHRLGHVPGALSLPREDFAGACARLRDRLEGARDGWLVVYCSSRSCEDSKLVRKALMDLGFRRVSVFLGGWAEWSAAGLPEEKQP